MTVGELIDRLVILHRDLPVILAMDAEGNSYNPLADINAMYYSRLCREAISPNEVDEYGRPDSVPVICLHPI